jgi:PPOX class probable F420-dependent enzyme
MRAKISKSLRKRLNEARVARLATVNLEGSPRVVPICFVLSRDTFYTAIDRKPKQVSSMRLKRVANIEATGEAALLVDEYSEQWNRLWYVLVSGPARQVRGAEQARAIRLLRRKYPQYSVRMLPNNSPVLRISVRTIKFWKFAQG